MSKLKINDKTVVLCKSEKDATDVLAIAHILGYKWDAGDSYLTETYWGEYPDLCYNLHKGIFGPASFYREQGYSIISAPSFMSLYHDITYTLSPVGAIYEDPNRSLTVIIKDAMKNPATSGIGYRLACALEVSPYFIVAH